MRRREKVVRSSTCSAPGKERRDTLLSPQNAVQLGDKEMRPQLVATLRPPRTSGGLDRMAALTWDSQKEGQETASTRSMRGQVPEKPLPLGARPLSLSCFSPRQPLL